MARQAITIIATFDRYVEAETPKEAARKVMDTLRGACGPGWNPSFVGAITKREEAELDHILGRFDWIA